MGEDRRTAIFAISLLLIITIGFSIGVVILTQSDLTLSRNDPLNEGDMQIDDECGILMENAREAVVNRRWNDAAVALSLVENLSCGIDYRIGAAELYRTMGQPRNSIEMLAPTVDDMKERFDLAAVYAWSLYEGGYVDSSRALLQQCREAHEFSGPAIRSFAWLAVELDESEAAMDLFARAIDGDPADPDLWRALSQVRLQGGDGNGALHAAYRAKQLAPESCDILLSCAWAHEAQGDTVEAIRTFTEAGELCPENGLVAFETGRFHFRGGRYGKAIPFLETAVKRDISPYSWLLMLGRARNKYGDSGGARQAFSLAALHDDVTYEAFLECARIERNAGEFEEARRLGQRARELDPGNEEVAWFLSHLPK